MRANEAQPDEVQSHCGRRREQVEGLLVVPSEREDDRDRAAQGVCELRLGAGDVVRLSAKIVLFFADFFFQFGHHMSFVKAA